MKQRTAQLETEWEIIRMLGEVINLRKDFGAITQSRAEKMAENKQG